MPYPYSGGFLKKVHRKGQTQIIKRLIPPEKSRQSFTIANARVPLTSPCLQLEKRIAQNPGRHINVTIILKKVLICFLLLTIL
jgi:hypothetical protein